MKIFAFADYSSDWYPKNAIELFKKYSSAEFVTDPEQADLVWIFSYYAASAFLALPSFVYKYLPLTPTRKRVFLHKPVLTTIHHLTPSKRSQWKPRVNTLDQVTDAWQTFSNINKTYFSSLFKKPIHLLPYWVDTQLFFSQTPEQRRALRQQHGLPMNKKIYGSFQRDTEADRKTPKLEKGPDIFCDIIEQLNPAETFVLLAGPRRDYIMHRLEQKNIPYRNLGKIPYPRMNDLYNMLDYYLVTARYEGGPQAILECLASQTKIFSTPVGIADILPASIVYKDAHEAVRRLHQPYPDVLAATYRIAQQHDCRLIIPQYEKFFAEFITTYAH